MDPGRMLPEQASAAHVPGLAVTFAAAFRDDATIRWPMPGATPAVLAELFGVILTPYARSGVLWKIGGYDGAAAWLPPAMAGRFAAIEQATRAAISPLTGDGGVRYAAFWDWLNDHLPGEPCWFLDLVAVAPAAQGRGLAAGSWRTAWSGPTPAGAPPSWKPPLPATSRFINPSASRSSASSKPRTAAP